MKIIGFFILEFITAHFIQGGDNNKDQNIGRSDPPFVLEEGGVNGNADVIWSATGMPTGGAISLTNHGGPTLTSPNIYVVFYGNNYWTADNTAMYVTFLKNLGTSNYMKYNTDFFKLGAPVLKGTVIVNGGSSTNEIASKTGIFGIIKTQIAAGAFGSKVADPQGIYILLTDPYKSKYLKTAKNHVFNVNFCGAHDFATLNGKKISFSYIGLANSGNCAWKFQTPTYTSSPTKDGFKDYVFSVLAHEVVECMSDPFFTAWYDSAGYEIADKCSGWAGASNFLNGPSSNGGPLYNAVIGGQYYLLESHYDNNAKKCLQSIW